MKAAPWLSVSQDVCLHSELEEFLRHLSFPLEKNVTNSTYLLPCMLDSNIAYIFFMSMVPSLLNNLFVSEHITTLPLLYLFYSSWQLLFSQRKNSIRKSQHQTLWWSKHYFCLEWLLMKEHFTHKTFLIFPLERNLWFDLPSCLLYYPIDMQ